MLGLLWQVSNGALCMNESQAQRCDHTSVLQSVHPALPFCLQAALCLSCYSTSQQHAASPACRDVGLGSPWSADARPKPNYQQGALAQPPVANCQPLERAQQPEALQVVEFFSLEPHDSLPHSPSFCTRSCTSGSPPPTLPPPDPQSPQGPPNVLGEEPEPERPAGTSSLDMEASCSGNASADLLGMDLESERVIVKKKRRRGGRSAARRRSHEQDADISSNQSKSILQTHTLTQQRQPRQQQQQQQEPQQQHARQATAAAASFTDLHLTYSIKAARSCQVRGCDSLCPCGGPRGCRGRGCLQ